MGLRDYGARCNNSELASQRASGEFVLCAPCAPHPAVSTQTASIDNLNQITSLSGQAYTYDAVGNLTSDGTRTYSWDAENRLIAIGYPGQPGKATAFTYDGLGRRIAIASTPAGGGSAIVVSYVWCGSGPCLARDASNAPIREYLAEGEYLPGTTPTLLYYAIDQIGSVRRVFSSAGGNPAYAFDPYGDPLQTTTPLTDAGYAGMFVNADSGLILTPNRAYDPNTGRWLSRDPAGEGADRSANLYEYVGGNPITLTDPLGLFCLPDAAKWAMEHPYATAALVGAAAFCIMGGCEILAAAALSALPEFLAALAADTAGAVALEGAAEGGVEAAAAGVAEGGGAAAAEGAEEGVTLYRGVDALHPGYGDALNGAANPIGGSASISDHVFLGRRLISIDPETD